MIDRDATEHPASGENPDDLPAFGAAGALSASIGDAGETWLEADDFAPASVGGAGATLAETGGPAAGGLIDGRLALLEKLGEGGMGVVWKARDSRLGRFVALKRPKGPMLSTTQGRARFLREARACAGLVHPNIITIHSVGEDRDGPFIEMEYIEGLALSEEVRRQGPCNETRARQLALAICDALALAHSRGIIHRDIKPANILLTARGIPRLGDFGLAAAGDDGGDRGAITATGAMLGTLYYSAPEQLRDATVADMRSDIYSLGATVYFLLTGEDPRRLRMERLPAGLRPVIEKALEEDPANRYPDMNALERALTAARVGGGEGCCPQCRQENPLTARHCTYCGASLQELFRPCPKCAVENRIDQKFCQGCGANLEIQFEIVRIKAAIAQGEATHHYAEIIAWAERGQALDSAEDAFARALAGARGQMTALKELRGKLEVIGPDQPEFRVVILERILELTPGDAAIQEDLAATRLEKQRLAEERRRVAMIRSIGEIREQLAKLPPEDIDERFLLLERLAALQPADAETEIQLRQVRKEKLRREIERLNGIARVQYEQHRFDEALATLEQARTLAPGSEALQRAAGRIADARDQFERSLRECQARLKALMARGEYAQVLEQIEKSPLALDPRLVQMREEAEKKFIKVRELAGQIQPLREDRAYVKLQQLLQELEALGAPPPPEREALRAECLNILERVKALRMAAMQAVGKRNYRRALAHYNQGFALCSDDQFLNFGKQSAMQALARQRQRNRRISGVLALAAVFMLILSFFWWASLQADDRDWENATQAATLAQYEAYLTFHPEGQYVSLAREKIEQLEVNERILRGETIRPATVVNPGRSGMPGALKKSSRNPKAGSKRSK